MGKKLREYPESRAKRRQFENRKTKKKENERMSPGQPNSKSPRKRENTENIFQN